MKTLAYVTFIVLSPPDLAGETFITVEPVECAPYIDYVLPLMEEEGWEMMARCKYTAAPATSPRPTARPTR